MGTLLGNLVHPATRRRAACISNTLALAASQKIFMIAVAYIAATGRWHLGEPSRRQKGEVPLAQSAARVAQRDVKRRASITRPISRVSTASCRCCAASTDTFTARAVAERVLAGVAALATFILACSADCACWSDKSPPGWGSGVAVVRLLELLMRTGFGVVELRLRRCAHLSRFYLKKRSQNERQAVDRTIHRSTIVAIASLRRDALTATSHREGHATWARCRDAVKSPGWWNSSQHKIYIFSKALSDNSRKLNLRNLFGADQLRHCQNEVATQLALV
jgi:hypothetical protein